MPQGSSSALTESSVFSAMKEAVASPSFPKQLSQAGRRSSFSTGKEPVEEKLACSTSSAYCFLAMPFGAIDLVIRPARQTVYRDALGMSVATQALNAK